MKLLAVFTTSSKRVLGVAAYVVIEICIIGSAIVDKENIDIPINKPFLNIFIKKITSQKKPAFFTDSSVFIVSLLSY